MSSWQVVELEEIQLASVASAVREQRGYVVAFEGDELVVGTTVLCELENAELEVELELADGAAVTLGVDTTSEVVEA